MTWLEGAVFYTLTHHTHSSLSNTPHSPLSHTTHSLDSPLTSLSHTHSTLHSSHITLTQLSTRSPLHSSHITLTQLSIHTHHTHFTHSTQLSIPHSHCSVPHLRLWPSAATYSPCAYSTRVNKSLDTSPCCVNCTSYWRIN